MSVINYLTEEEEEDMLFPFRVGDIVRDTSMMGGRFLAVTELLGQGAYAVVYQVKDTKTGKLYALKCLCKRGLSWEQLTLQREEAKLQKSLGQHPNIVRLERYFENKDWLFLVLEYCSGSDLFCWITEKKDEFDSQGRRRSPMERRQLIKNVFKQILTAVTYCHARGVFHRDLKPENFLVTAGGNVKLCDFGLATLEEASQDFDCGSKPYMSYECRVELSTTYSPRQADIWSLGILLLSILYRRTPWAEAVPETNHNFNQYLQDPFSYLYHEFGCEYDLADFLARRVLSPVKQRVSCADWLRLWTDNVIFTCSINITGRRASPLRPDTSRLRELLDEIKEQRQAPVAVLLKRNTSWSNVLDDEEDEMDFSAPMVFEEDDDPATDVEEESNINFGVISCSPSIGSGAANPSEFAVPTPIKVSTSMCTVVGTPTPSSLFNTPALIKRFSIAAGEAAGGGGEDEMIFAMDVL